MAHAERTFIPAAGRDWLLPLYDPFSKLFGSEAAHRRLIEQAEFQPGQRVLEIGCGTGSLTLLIKSLHPSLDVVGLDPDPKALARAQRKMERAGRAIQLDRGFADQLPYADKEYDRVLSAFMFHHLKRDEKANTLREVRRVLKPGGSFHLLDFGGEHDHSHGVLMRLFHSEGMQDNSSQTILELLRAAGFAAPAEIDSQRRIFGRIFYYRAAAPGLTG